MTYKVILSDEVACMCMQDVYQLWGCSVGKLTLELVKADSATVVSGVGTEAYVMCVGVCVLQRLNNASNVLNIT